MLPADLRVPTPARKLALSAALLVGITLLFPARGWAGTSPVTTSPMPASLHDMILPPADLIGPAQPAESSESLMSPPANPQVGDSWYWWLFIHGSTGPHFEQRMCTVRGKTDHAYVVVEDTQWLTHVNQADVDQILERWENSSIGSFPDEGIYQLNSENFGEPPDELDNDPRIYIVWFDFGISSDGFFFSFDEAPDDPGSGVRSNECEVLYMNSNNGQDPGGDYMIAVIAHEFEHLIHWKYDPYELSWVNEGMAELAMWLYGNPDTISSFPANPDNSLTAWSGAWADYIKTYLWSLYFYERYGGQNGVFTLVHETSQSITGYENALDDLGYSDNFADVFANWAVANYLDDPSLSDGRFGYLGDDLPPFTVAGSWSSYPVPDQNRTVSHWGTDYYRFQNFGTIGALQIQFDGVDNTVFAVWGLVLHGDGTTDVLRMNLDPGTQSGTLVAGGLNPVGDQVILVVAGTSSVGSTSYVFNAQQSPSDVAVSFPPASQVQFRASPNPSPGDMSFHLAWDGQATWSPRVDIYDPAGRRVRSLSAPGGPGEVTLHWDGRDAARQLVAPGVYYARVQVGDRSLARPLVLIR